eukprot:TRINITY_DN10024_c0_g1_i1.p1 TRINITY_DN10024_c0_g1~~TRINITY_DN10024_c0_g1_i1.p1  ORF type:complete len:309 (+),score=23.77 TRINITY_DN10024_c0_g1_i1:1041-1967(+)
MSGAASASSSPPPQHHVLSALDNIKVLSSGAFAGALSRTATAPLERLKIFNQVGGISANASRYNSIFGSLLQMYREEGPRGFFKGNGTNCVKVVPASAIRFLAFENIKQKLLIGTDKQLTTTRKLIAGSSAGVIAVAATYPLDLIRTRLSLQVAEKHYHGIGDALIKIFKNQGITGLFRGVSTAMASVAPFSALNFTAYEVLKEFFAARQTEKLPMWMSAGFGAASGTFAMTILYPLDLLKRRLMVQGHGDSAVKYRNGFHAVRVIVAEEGVAGLYRGIVPSYMKVIPTVSLTWYTYEVFKKYLGIKK